MPAIMMKHTFTVSVNLFKLLLNKTEIFAVVIML